MLTFAQIRHYGVAGIVTFACVVGTVLVVCFLGGLTSAIIEARRERAAGLEVTRPAREIKARRQALGGWHAALYTSSKKLAHRGMKLCWCGRGPLQYFRALDAGQVEGMGCVAWESGDLEALRLHDAAGGYQRRVLDERGRRRVAV